MLSEAALEALELLTFGPLKEYGPPAEPGRHVIVYSDPACSSSTLSADRLMLAHNYAAAGSSLHCTPAELAQRILRRKNRSAGVAYARHMYAGICRPSKVAARARVMKFFGPWAWPRPLRILTMPGLRWTFEHDLLAERDAATHRTEIYAVENDPAIFRAAQYFMPGQMQGTPASESGAFARSARVAGYYYQDAEELMRELSLADVNAAWFDFTGTLTRERINALRRFWHSVKPDVLAVTWLNARYKSPVAEQLAEFRAKTGKDACDFLIEMLGYVPSGSGRVSKKSAAVPCELDRHRYTDGFSAMAQIVVGQRGGMS
jgi:hypothetical protein